MSASNHVYLHGVKADKVSVEVLEGKVRISVDSEGGSYLWVTMFTDEPVGVARNLIATVVNA